MTTESYKPSDTALILIDLLNEFLAEDGKLAGGIAEVADRVGLKHNLTRLIEGAREAGLTIIYAPHGLDEHCFDHVHHVHPRFQWAMENKMFWKGTPGADFYAPLAPRDGDIVVARHHMFDSYQGTDLQEQLQKAGVTKVVLAGLTSQTCIEGTGRHSLENGYHVTFLTDAVAEFSEAAHKAALEISYPTFGHAVMTIDEFLSSVSSDEA